MGDVLHDARGQREGHSHWTRQPGIIHSHLASHLDADPLHRQELKYLRGKRRGGEPESEVEHFRTCVACGQSFHMRSFAQAFHHNETGHHRLTDAERTEFDPSGPHSGTGVLSGRRN
jgi:hypothetical protein